MSRKIIAAGIVLLVVFCASFLLSYGTEPDMPGPSNDCHLVWYNGAYHCEPGYTPGQIRCECDRDPR